MGCLCSIPDPHPVYSKYKLGKRINGGAFSKINVITGLTKENKGQERALKITKLAGRDEMVKEALRREIDILQICGHPHIIRLYEHHQHESKMWMVLDICKGGALFDQIIKVGSDFSERVAAKIIFQIASALEHIHSLDIVHRDLKPENIMFQDDVSDLNFDKVQMKIIDFGLAVQSKEPLTQQCGTPSYIAPEIVNNRSYHAQVDVWALGVILYIILSGTWPFQGSVADKSILYKNIRRAHVPFPEENWRKISLESQDLIKQMLEKKAKERITSGKIKDHPWIQGNYVEEEGMELGMQFEDTFRRNVTMDRLRKGVRAVMTLNKLVAIWEEEKGLDATVTAELPTAKTSNASTPDVPPLATTFSGDIIEQDEVTSTKSSRSKSRNLSEDAITPSSSTSVPQMNV